MWIVDVLLTCLVFLFFFAVVYYLSFLYFGFDVFVMDLAWFGVGPLFIFFAFPAFATTLLTSIWLWLYLGTAAPVDAWRSLQWGMHLLHRVFGAATLQDHPMSILGAIAAVALTVLFWGAILLAWLISNPAPGPIS